MSHMFPETIRVLCLLIIGYVVQNERTDNWIIWSIYFKEEEHIGVKLL